MKPSEFYGKCMVQDHNGNWHKLRPLTEQEKQIMDKKPFIMAFNRGRRSHSPEALEKIKSMKFKK